MAKEKTDAELVAIEEKRKQLVAEKRAAGLPLEDAMDVANRQIRNDERIAEEEAAAAAEAAKKKK